MLAQLAITGQRAHHLVSLIGERAGQAGDGVAEAPGLGQGRQLGCDEQDAH
jgi:hypothetical protein